MTESPIQFDASELFFSTTDARGVIEQANSVFVRLSGHPWEELVGAPHNIIRHDDMPGGAFKLMWQTLQAGEPFCAYVINRAADGRPYTVFSTITPLGEGYLSVRSLPCVPELHDIAFSLYAPTRALEREVLARGESAPAAATAGLEHLAGLLAEAGLSSYNEFVEAALPAEVEARAKITHGVAHREGSGPLHDLLGSVHKVEAELTSWTAQMVSLAELTDALQAGTSSLQSVMEASRRTASDVSSAAGAASPIMLTVNVWASMVPEIETQLDALVGSLKDLAASCAKARFRIALARLHNDSMGAFVTELIDADQSDGETASGVDACRDLGTALHEGVEAAAELSRHNVEVASRLAAEIESVRSLMLIPQSLLGSWQTMVADRADDDRIAQLLPRMAEQIAEGDRGSQTLSTLAVSCREKVLPLQTRGIETELARAGALLDEIDEDPEEPSFDVAPRRGI